MNVQFLFFFFHFQMEITWRFGQERLVLNPFFLLFIFLPQLSFVSDEKANSLLIIVNGSSQRLYSIVLSLVAENRVRGVHFAIRPV